MLKVVNEIRAESPWQNWIFYTLTPPTRTMAAVVEDMTGTNAAEGIAMPKKGRHPRRTQRR